MPAGARPAPGELLTPQALVARGEFEGLAELGRELGPGAVESVRRRHPGLDPAVVSALAAQSALAARAAGRLGELAATWVLDDEALQQATRLEVARYRASQLARRTAARTVADLGCGLGVDSYALAEAGFTVRAVESDPWRAEAAALNLRACASVTCGDVRTLPTEWWSDVEVAYVDPARRGPDAPRDLRGGRSRALADPEDWSPPWSWIRDLAERTPVVVKAAPGIDVRRIPARADVEWIDDHGDCIEATVWMAPLGAGERRATVLREGEAAHVAGPRAAPGPVPPGTAVAAGWLLEPSPAVRRANLIDELGQQVQAVRLSGTDWLTADVAPDSPLVTAWAVVEEVPWAAKSLRAWLRDAGPVTWKTADAGLSATACDRRVGHRPARDGTPVTLVVTAQRRVFAVAQRPA